ncbi:nucleotide sugar dehydrogenase [Brachybacterium sp. P6-10-X1]|uniref:NAD(P)-dependent oxidoreductase n=1 Tax=Brachybacterium sp. P6-10-X1 TaxID=1903186 RepID=UPI00097180CC|nr:NAD(P)-dependent oxidoreductase [Brachybacterium sp. P6-10-X1]APX33308.1 nucleotide sugar dehydrogenase [Brachybacterium sp. P6-10-X1]
MTERTATPPDLTAHRQVTVVGIGAIGLPMALRLAASGAEVTGVDPVAASRDAARALGLAAEASAGSAATADVVICMVATPQQLREAALGESGLLATMRPGATLVVMSTVGVAPVDEVLAAADGTGIGVLDVPVTGGVAGAEAGTLTLFASGDPARIAVLRPLLETMGSLRDCGPVVGRGQAMKAVNQFLASVHLVAAAEALAFADSLGVDPAEAFDAVSGGAGGSWMLTDRGPRMLEGIDAQVTSTIGIFVKDSGLVCDMAEDLGFEAPLVAAARDRFQAAAEQDLLRRDDSQVIRTYLGR